MTATATAGPFTYSPMHDFGDGRQYSIAEINAQVTELLRVTDNIAREAQELRDLREHRGQVQTRRFLEEPDARLRKYEIETGYDRRFLAYRAAPLEPWTGPPGSKRLYRNVMFDAPLPVGAYTTARARAALTWMRDEGLAGVDDNGLVRPLSDQAPAARRSYPGAPVSDAEVRRSLSRYLREHGTALVLAAMANLMRHLPARRGLRRKLALADRRGGMSLSAYDIATEANTLKSKRPDLHEYRYLSVSAVRAIIKRLLGNGSLTEAEPPRAMRVRRSWRTLPRIFARTERPAVDPPPDLP